MIGRTLGLAAALCAGAACGKKGPPLAPIVRIPAAVETIEAERVGNDVYVTLTIPAANVDDHTPADVNRVEVYAYTGPAAPPRGRFFDLASRVAIVPVAPAPVPDDDDDDADETPVVSKDPPQGATVTIRDTLTADELAPRVDEPRTTNPEPGTEPRTANTNPEPGTGNREQPLLRFYSALAFSPRNRWSPIGGVAEIPLLPVPDAPSHAEAAYTERQVTIAWAPAGGLLGFLFERPLPEEPTPFPIDIASEPPPAGAAGGPLRYNIYRTDVPDIFAPPGAAAEPWTAAPPSPINRVPVAAFVYTDPVQFGVSRCYTVRGVRGTGPDARIGDASVPACVTPVDTFPPAPPRSLAAVATEGAISLIWEPNQELDLGGYVVLRGDAPGDTLQPLTQVADARYRDDAVRPGVRYVYAVVALDSRFPLANVSAASNRVEESAR